MFGAKDLLSFDRLLTPSIIKLVYFIGLIAIALSGLGAAFGNLSGYGGGFFGFLLSIIGALFGLVLWRVIIESTIVFFGIFERLGEIRDNAKAPPTL